MIGKHHVQDEREKKHKKRMKEGQKIDMRNNKREMKVE